MPCFNPQPTYVNPPFAGIQIARSAGDGYAILVGYYKAYSPRLDYRVIYNVYYSTNAEEVFNEGIKFVVINQDVTSISIPDLVPGDVYYFAVRGATLPINMTNVIQFPAQDGLNIYPESYLTQDITDEDVLIPLEDVEIFPSFGIIQIGAELIQYTSIDYTNNYLITDIGRRGLFGTVPRMHTVDGYDGYRTYSPIISHFKGFEEQNTSTMFAENTYSPFKYAFTASDGYKDKNHIVYPDTDISDCFNESFKKYDYAGYHGTRIDDYLSGNISNSYFGGEAFCADGYGSSGLNVRGLNIQDHQNQREEMLLETTGRPMVLLKRMVSGKASMHYDNHRENTAHRGLDTYGTDIVLGYEQFFNPRRSDGRIMVRFSPTMEDIERTEMGLENQFKPNAWTLSYPTLKDGDVLIAFNRDGTEEFRYEIINVTRNTTFLGIDGMQAFTAVRIRRTDPINQFTANYNTSLIPVELTTSIGLVAGSIPPHVHSVTISSDGVVSLSQITQVTGVAAGHNHEVINGVVQEVLGHTHTLLLP